MDTVLKLCSIDEITRSAQIYSDDLVIAHISDNTDVLHTILFLTEQMRNMGRIRNVFILSPERLEGFHKKYSWCRIIHCEKEKIRLIERTYAVIKFSSQLIFDVFNRIYDADPLKLWGVNNITLKELLSYAVFNDERLLENHGNNKRIPEFERKYIDWEKTDPSKDYSGCRDLDDMLRVVNERILNKGDKVTLFAVTPTMERILGSFRERYIVSVSDNDPRKWGGDVQGIEVIPPDELKNNKSIIFVTSYRYKAVFEQLYAMGYEPGRNLFALHESVLSFRKVDKELQYAEEKLERGERRYNSFRDKYGDRWIYVNPHTGTGDVYMSWLYITQNETLSDSRDYVLLVQTESCRKLAELLGMSNEKASLEDISDLAAYGRYMGMENTKIKILNYSFEQFAVSRLRGFKGLDYNTMLQKTVFDAPGRARSMKLPQSSSDGLFEEYNLKKGKTVLLSPYAVHGGNASADLWVRLSRHLLDAGFDVCTNISGNEKKIPGTTGLYLGYDELADFVEKAGFFIGIRNGLCDIISPSDCRMTILYPEYLVSKMGTYFSYFSLEKMGLRSSNLLEMEFDGCINEEQMNDIVRFCTMNNCNEG